MPATLQQVCMQLRRRQGFVLLPNFIMENRKPLDRCKQSSSCPYSLFSCWYYFLLILGKVRSRSHAPAVAPKNIPQYFYITSNPGYALVPTPTLVAAQIQQRPLTSKCPHVMVIIVRVEPTLPCSLNNVMTDAQLPGHFMGATLALRSKRRPQV